MTKIDLDVLRANEVFYGAFAARDLAAMERVWAEDHPVACIHPGWDILSGRTEVLASWRGILGADDAPRISCSFAEAHVLGDTVLVTCHELLPGGRFAATNVFVREAGAWRLVHHQATPIAPGQVRARAPAGPVN